MARKPTMLMLQGGRVVLNPERLFYRPAVLLPNQPFNAISMAANGNSGPWAATVSGEGPILVHKLAYEATGALTVLLSLQDGLGNRSLMNGPVHVDTIFGSGQQSFWLPAPLFLMENALLRGQCSDLSGASNSFLPAFIGEQLLKPVDDKSGAIQKDRLQRRQYIELPYFYTLDTGPASFAGSDTVNGTIAISNEGHFLVTHISRVKTGNFNIDIFEQARNESIVRAPSMQHYPVADTLLCGTGNFPVRLAEPWLIPAGSKLNVTLKDTSGTANKVYLTLAGLFLRTGDAR